MLRRTIASFNLQSPTAAFSLTYLRSHAKYLHQRRTTLSAKLTVLDATKSTIDASVNKHLDGWAVGGFVYLVAQTGVLFNWVYFRFDWNLVEPITYLLGYSVVFLSIACFFHTGKEFTYDNLRMMIGDRKRIKLYRKSGFNIDEYCTVRAEIADLDRRIQQLNIPTE